MKNGIVKAFIVLMTTFMLISVLPFFVGASETEKKDVIIGFKDEINTALIKTYGGKIELELEEINAVATSLSESAIKTLKKNKNIEYIESDKEVEIAVDTLTWGVDRIDAEIVWGGSEDATDVTGNGGSGVQVAVLDTGIDYTHPELDGNYKGGYDFINDDNDPKDDNGHGTHCAGIIGAEDNGVGVIGVAPEVDLYAVKVLDKDGRGPYSAIAAGILWAAKGPDGEEGNADDAEVISLSLAGIDDSTMSAAIEYAYTHGTLPVAAAGNYPGGYNYVLYPAKYPGAIAVSAIDDEDTLASISRYGNEIELTAHGEDVYSTMPTYTVTLTKGQYKYSKNYDELTGTSMACPHVSGVAALIFAAGITDSDDDGTNIADDVREILNNTAEDLGSTGWDQYFGYGVVDAEAAVDAVGSGNPTVAITQPTGGSEISGTVNIQANGADDDGSVTKVEFFLDGSLLGTDNSGVDGWSYSWDTTSVNDGDHILKAVATDDDSNNAFHSISLTTENTDHAPAVSWVDPEDEDSLTGTVAIRITASDDRDSASSLTVQWKVDEGSWITASYNSDSGYFEYSWDTTGVSDGDCELYARAVDSSSNQGIDAIGATIVNTVGGMYVWSISWSAATPHLKGTITIRYDSDGDATSELSDSPVSGASVVFIVRVDTDDDDGYDDDSKTITGTTDSNGQMSFVWKKPTSGSYEGEVTSLTHSTYEWNSDMDADNPDHYM